jgi:hypothetical protein
MPKKGVGITGTHVHPRRLGRGRPITHTEAWAKVSVVLFERQIVDLDRLTTDVRRKNGQVLNRAEIIRALVDGLIGSGLDVTKYGSEATLRACVQKCLRRAARAPR